MTDGPLSSGPHEVLHFVAQSEITGPPILNFSPSFSPPPPPVSFSLRLSPSLHLCVFFIVSSQRLILSRSFAQRTSRSRVGHTPVRVKVSSVPAPCFFPTFATPPPSTHGDHYLPRHSTDARPLLILNHTRPRRVPRPTAMRPSSVSARRFLSADFFFLHDSKRPRLHVNTNKKILLDTKIRRSLNTKLFNQTYNCHVSCRIFLFL